MGDDTREKGIMVKRNSSAVIESEDEDGFPISFSSRKKNVVEDSEGNSNLKSDDKTVTEDLEKKIDTRCVLCIGIDCFSILSFI